MRFNLPLVRRTRTTIANPPLPALGVVLVPMLGLGLNIEEREGTAHVQYYNIPSLWKGTDGMDGRERIGAVRSVLDSELDSHIHVLGYR